MKNNHRTFVTGRSRGKMALIYGVKNPSVRKMPRKMKKQFIKKNGREAYKNWCKLDSFIKHLRDLIGRREIDRCFERQYLGCWTNPDYGYGRQVYVNGNN